jgi:hypothetical protein
LAGTFAGNRLVKSFPQKELLEDRTQHEQVLEEMDERLETSQTQFTMPNAERRKQLEEIAEGARKEGEARIERKRFNLDWPYLSRLWSNRVGRGEML